MWKEIRRRLGEAASLLSCALNILLGTGDREITLSAGAWELRRCGTWRGWLLVPLIDAINRPFVGRDHCRRAWLDHGMLWRKVRGEVGHA